MPEELKTMGRLSMPEELVLAIGVACLSMPQSSPIELLLKLRRVCKCWQREVQERVLKCHTTRPGQFHKNYLYDIICARNINAISPSSYRFLDTGLQISSCGPSLALTILNERSKRSFTDFNDLRQRVQDISDAHVQSLQNAGFYVEMIAAVCEQMVGHDTRHVLDLFAAWIVLTAVCAAQKSAACRPEAKLPAISMAIYTSAYHVTILLKNAGLEEAQDAALKEWRESVSERVSRALEERNVRPTREQIKKILVGIHTRYTRHVQDQSCS